MRSTRTLLSTARNSPHICTVEGHACSQATADRLICENPHRRTASDTQVRILIQMQAGCCAYPGCPHTRWLHAHHIVRWSRGGKTVVENLVLICQKRHRLLDEGHYSLTRESGELAFRNEDGVLIDTSGKLDWIAPRQRDLSDLPTPRAEDIHPGEWFTTRMNHEYAIDGLVAQ